MSDPRPIHQTLAHSALGPAAHGAGLGRFLGAIACHDGQTRGFFAHSDPESLAPPQGGEIRAIGHGLMLTLPRPLEPIADTSLSLPTQPEETARFQGENCLLLMRLAETPAQLAESLIWHCAQHGATAALIVNRAPAGEGAEFAASLAALIAPACPGFNLLVLDLSQPSGARDQGSETLAYLAPDAPGKDRMARPLPDPWRAPLDEPALYELLKWLYLAKARAVISLEACDILPKLGPEPAFDLVAKAKALMLIGQRSYPWRLRPGQPARFGDHICRMFDTTQGIARWGCAPEALGLEKTWRRARISYAKARQAYPFFRAMALRASEAGDLPIAPKTALVEDPALLSLAHQLGAKPVRPPASSREKIAPELPKTESPSPKARRVAIVTTMKNEGPFILEWLAYHRAIGVTDFLIYTNDCSDGTDQLLQLLMAKGLVEWRENPFRGTDLKPQHAALQAAEAEPVMQNCDWGICMDVDEFINIKLGDGHLSTLFAAMEAALPGANMIALTWRLFGNAETHAFKDDLMLGQFSRCAPEFSRKPHQAWGFKTLFQNIQTYKKLGVHRPKGLKPDLWEEVRWLNGSGKPLPKEMFRNGWRSTATTYGYDWVQLNHYAVRSAESFLVKRDRGRVNHVDRDQGLNYWFRMNHNAESETSIQRMIPETRAELARLMEDPAIAALHHQAVAHHRAKIAALKATPNYADFYATLTSPRMEAICRAQKHFGAAVFNAGPASIPEDLPLEDLAEDFFFTTDYEGAQQH